MGRSYDRPFILHKKTAILGCFLFLHNLYFFAGFPVGKNRLVIKVKHIGNFL